MKIKYDNLECAVCNMQTPQFDRLNMMMQTPYTKTFEMYTTTYTIYTLAPHETNSFNLK